MMVVDHVVLVVPDAAEAARELRERHGLGSERGPYHPFAGTRNHTVPLEPPAYLEFLTIENRDAAERTETGRRVLECEAAGFGLLGWAVLVDDSTTSPPVSGSTSSTTRSSTATARCAGGAP